jgi:hypothetical protein
MIRGTTSEHSGCMKDVDTLEARFKAELRGALLRAARGRSPTLFSMDETRARSSARVLRAKAERIIELRRSYSVDRSIEPVAAKYLKACLAWKHLHQGAREAVPAIAKQLLRELEIHGT